MTVQVSGKWVEAQDICGFELRNPDGTSLPAFTAGSHIDVHLPGGLVRQYSLCGDPGSADRYEVAVLRDAGGRGGSIAIHDLVHVGDFLQVSVPRNHFAIEQNATRHLLLAGGIGVTPILSMAEYLSSRGESFDMHYCTRSESRTAFIARISESDFCDRVQFHYDNGDASQRFDLTSTLTEEQESTHLYVCGPRGFMDGVLSAARAQGWTEDRLHYEFFSGTVTKLEGDAPFQVRLASSGAVVDVPAGSTVVEALATHGVEILTSCEQGVCGTCLTRVLEGQPDHRDSYLTEEERASGDQFMPCCSRSKSTLLVLDL
nr:PDR/VanB family oxidoreductase [Paraburkholderia sp. SG-MS1]